MRRISLAATLVAALFSFKSVAESRSAVAQEARCIPVFATDKKESLKGFRCFEIKEKSMLKQLGVQDRDIIIRVGRHDLQDLELAKSSNLLFELGRGEHKSIRVERDGKTFDLEALNP